MGLTSQQQQVIDAVMDPSIPLIKIKAVAGAGKTFTLVEAAKTYNPKTGIYIAYNKAIADEAAQKFKGTNIRCSTIHSLAYAATVRPYSLNVGHFGPRSIQGQNAQGRPLSYKEKMEIIGHIKKFCLSDHLEPIDYIDAVKMDSDVADLFEDQLNMMADGSQVCPHDFYLKLYHVLMANGSIEIPSVDMLLVDECGDINRLTLAIFEMINAKKKIAVGDPMQNIYSFNETINAFTELQDKGLEILLDQSFRVSFDIAFAVEDFVQRHLDDKFSFLGNTYPNGKPELDTFAYISRTNSGLLEEMFTLMESNTPFHLTRRIDTVLELPLILANINSGNPITEKKWSHIENPRKAWETNPALKQRFGSAGEYIRYVNKDDEEIKLAMKVLAKHSPKDLNTLTKYVKNNINNECDLTLTTAHSSKGLEFSSVTLAPDLNFAAEKAIAEIIDTKRGNSWNKEKILNSLEEELRLYYVACSRAMTQLKNATLLKKVTTL